MEVQTTEWSIADIAWERRVLCLADALDDLAYGESFSELTARNPDKAHALRHNAFAAVMTDIIFGEAAALQICSLTRMVASDTQALALESQAKEEAKHTEAFLAYMRPVPGGCNFAAPFQPCPYLFDYVMEVMAQEDFASKVFGLFILDEAADRIMSTMLPWARCAVFKDLLSRIVGDESRHLEVGKQLLPGGSPARSEALNILLNQVTEHRYERAELIMKRSGVACPSASE